MDSFGPIPGQAHHFVALTDKSERRYGLERFMAETRRLYGVMDSPLAEHKSFAGGALSIADFAIPRLGLAPRTTPHRSGGICTRAALVRADDGAARGRPRLCGAVALNDITLRGRNPFGADRPALRDMTTAFIGYRMSRSQSP